MAGAPRYYPRAPPGRAAAEVVFWGRTVNKQTRQSKRRAAAPVDKAAAARKRLAQSAEWNKAASAEARDIAPLPAVADAGRRDACRLDLLRFCGEYFAAAFPLEFSPAHIALIKALETAILTGGQICVAMPRGSGKTTIIIAAIVWAIVYGHRKFSVVVGATDRHAARILATIIAHLCAPGPLADDFPGVCYPLQKLGWIKHRIAGQTLNGEPTRQSWSKSEFVAATVPGELSSGCAITAVGLTGAIRGLSRALADGQIIRPGLVLIDDPQTAESAKSAEQVADRLRIIEADILGLAGPGETIAAVCACTVIAPGDAADQLLDPDIYQSWQKLKYPLLEAMPKNMELWQQYWDIYREAMRTEHNAKAATEYYLQRREEMDAGAVVVWEARKKADEATALEGAMRLYFSLGAEVFGAEYQNAPRRLGDSAVRQLDPGDLAPRLTGNPRGVASETHDLVVAAVDVQKKRLYFCVAAFSPAWGCEVIDYGAYPDPRKRIFKALDDGHTIADAYPGLPDAAALSAAIGDLVAALMSREWRLTDGREVTARAALVDSGWQPDAVAAALKSTPWRAIVLPSRGRGIGPAEKPISEYRKGIGDKIGWHYYIKKPMPRAPRELCIDTYFFKSMIRDAIFCPAQAPDALRFCGDKPYEHDMLFSHLTAERYTPTAGRGRIVDIWRNPPHAENHFFDCLTACYAAAAWAGLTPPGGEKSAPRHERPAPVAAQAATQPPAAPQAAQSWGRAAGGGGWGRNAGQAGGGWGRPRK